MKYTLGISAGFHDAAAAVIDNHGKIVFAGPPFWGGDRAGSRVQFASARLMMP